MAKKKQSLAAARKAAATPCYKTSGPLAAAAEERLRFYLQGTPVELHALRASLLPFDDVIIGGTRGDNSAEALGLTGKKWGEPYFMVQTPDPQNPSNEYRFVVSATCIIGQMEIHDEDGEVELDTPFSMTLAGLHNFLRQLPRHANAFAGI